MTDPVFDKEGNLSNLDELSVEEVASAYHEKNRQLFGRATDAETKRDEAVAEKAKLEQELHELKKPATPAVPPVQTGPQNDPEELRLVARGFSDEEIAQAKVIAKGMGVGLSEAVISELFSIWKSKQDEEAKREAAKLGASSGSGNGERETHVKSGMTREEHREAWRKAAGGK